MGANSNPLAAGFVQGVLNLSEVVQSLSQWQEKYPGKEWENQLATFDQTLYMGCNDMTSAEYISKKSGPDDEADSPPGR